MCTGTQHTYDGQKIKGELDSFKLNWMSRLPISETFSILDTSLVQKHFFNVKGLDLDNFFLEKKGPWCPFVNLKQLSPFSQQGQMVSRALILCHNQNPYTRNEDIFLSGQNMFLTLLRVPSRLLISHVLPFLFAFTQLSVLPHCSSFKHLFLGPLKTLCSYKPNLLYCQPLNRIVCVPASLCLNLDFPLSPELTLLLLPGSP